jgi:hypothetical protein
MWSKKIVEWTEGNRAFLSIVFTWKLPEAWSRCIWYKQQGYEVFTGGPATKLLPDYLKDVSSNHVVLTALNRHNSEATRTSTGCPNACSFCGVRLIEPEFKELPSWEPAPIVCDNNLTACSMRHFDKVIDSLKPVHGVDFNQGLDARKLTDHHVERLTELDLLCVRFAWDNINSESAVFDAINKCIVAGIPKSKIRIYVLLGYHDTPDDALYRLQSLKDFGISKPFPMRYQPLDALVKDSEVMAPWTEYELGRYMRYWSRQAYLAGIPFKDYRG